MIKRKKVILGKKGFEMSFGMIFSIIAGAVILFLAIYATTKLVTTSQYTLYSESAQNIGNLLNPIVNDISVATKSPEINFKKETQIYLSCYAKDYLSPVFGRETISFSEQSGFFGGWSTPGANISRYNKYIFGQMMQQGKTIYLFSKPFYLGYKVDDLVFLTLNSYCFIAPPQYIKEEVESLSLKNVNISSQITQCSKNTIKACFGFTAAGCNMTIYPNGAQYETGRVVKSGRTLEYAGSLIYAAIFSSPEIYECNVKRLGAKTIELAQIYKEKITTVKTKGCSTQIENNLNTMINLANNLTSTKLKNLYDEAKIMDDKNCRAECKIYPSQTC